MTASRAGRCGAATLALALLSLGFIAPHASAATPLGDYYDPFPSATYAGSAGSITWSSPWQESNDDADSNAGAVQVDQEGNCADDYCLVIGKDGGATAAVRRTADLSSADSATLSFDYAIHKHGGSGHVELSVSATGGEPWRLLRDFDLSVNSSSGLEYDISAEIESTTTIRFELFGSTDASHLNVDDVRIELFAEDNVAPELDPIANSTIPEEVPFTFTAGATDANGGDELTFSLDGSQPPGAAMSGGGVFTWTPTESQGPGIYSFDVIVTDDGTPELSDSQTVTLTVAETNAPPVLAPIGDKSVAEGSLLAFTASAVDPDTPAGALRFSLTGSPPSGAAITTDGVFTWTPSETQGPGTYPFGVKVTDDGQPDGFRSDTELISVTVTESNRPPALAAIADKIVAEGTLVTFTASATDPDLPANNLTYTMTGGPAGASLSTAGSFTWTPSEAQGPGTYTFTVAVTDNGVPAKSDTESVTITVNEANIAPVIDPIGTKTVAEGSLLRFTVTASDTDSPPDSFDFSLAGAPPGASITPGGTFSWTPTEQQGPGTYHLDVVATDDGSPPMARSTAVTVIVTEVNAPPVLAAIPDRTITEGTDFTLTVRATDGDSPANSLAFSLTGAPAGATIDQSGVFRWTPSEAQGPGTYSFGIVVTDDGSPPLADSQSVTIAVIDGNNAPVIDPMDPVNGTEGELIRFMAHATDPDLPADGFSFWLAGNPPAGAALSAAGVFTWTPGEIHGPGSYTFDVSVTDTGSPPRTATRSVTVIVAEANQPPLLDIADSYSAEAGFPYLLTAAATDPDLPAQTLLYAADGLPDGAVMSTTGELTWQPTAAMVGDRYTVTITVTDDGTPAMSGSAAFTLTVVAANRAPELAPIEDTQLTIGETLRFSAVATDPDGPADELIFSLGPGAPAGATIDPTSGAFEWRPGAAQNDAGFAVTITVTDGGEIPKSDSETFTVTVGRPNVPPTMTAPPDQHNMPGDRVLLVVPGADPDGYPTRLSYSASNLPPGLNIDTKTGTIAGAVGFDGLLRSPFTVAVSVSDGRATTSVEFVWKVTGVANPPEATPTKTAVVAGIVDINSPPTSPSATRSEITRSLVIMSRAVRTGVAEMSLPILLLVLVGGGLIAFGRVGLVPLVRRGTLHEGVIRRYDRETGSGLVSRSSDGREVFVHASAVARRDRQLLTAGDNVVFRTIDGAYRDLVTRLRRRG